MHSYRGEYSNAISYPLGGIGAGTICMTGWGALESFSLRHQPEKNFCPVVFSAISIAGSPESARILEGPVPKVHYYLNVPEANRGLQVSPRGRTFGLPRFTSGEFSARFPFAEVVLTDTALPLSVKVTGWSPFIPGRADDSGLPFAAVEYAITNTGADMLDAVYSFNAQDFIGYDDHGVRAVKDGFVFEKISKMAKPEDSWAFCAAADNALVNIAWYRSNIWFDTLTMQWNRICSGLFEQHDYPDPMAGNSPGGSLFVPIRLLPGETQTVRLRLCWYAPSSDLRIGAGDDEIPVEERRDLPVYQPWYINVIDGIDNASIAWEARYDKLLRETAAFSETLFQSNIPPDLLDAVSSNLCILKSPTVLRQIDGRIWGWEGCEDKEGSCHGSCTHVWNYAQAICNIFPELERGMRHTELYDMQDNVTGHQEFRAYLPIRPARHLYYAAADGQLGGIIKVYRDWRISGDTEWLRGIWFRLRQSILYCIDEWDQNHEGLLIRPHHNTYDIEFHGADGMCMCFYASALRAMSEMAEAIGEDNSEYRKLYEKVRTHLERDLWNGEYFIQKVSRENCASGASAPSEIRALIDAEGSPYQYGDGCMSDGVLGIWLGEISGMADIIDNKKVVAALESIYKYNFRKDFKAHANPQRPGYAAADEPGLVLCSWPNGNKPALPFVYSDEVWTGIEYQVASHLLMKGEKEKALDMVRAVRTRYNGQYRNPFAEYECGEWYARAMSSYSLLSAYTGVRYDAVTKTLFASARNADSFDCFFAWGATYGTVSLYNGTLSFRPVRGQLDVREVKIG